VWITNPKSGCTMEMMAKEFMIAPAFRKLEARYGESLMVIAYMNTSGRVKALAGRTGGAVCTSSNAGAIMRWAIAQKKKIFFVPDQHLGRNVAAEIGLAPEKTRLVPAGHEGADIGEAELRKLDAADLLLWGSFCGVHTIFKPSHVQYWRGRGYQIAVHPESPREVVAIADFFGSTSQLWKHVLDAPRGSRFAVATEGHFVNNLREQAKLRGSEVVHLADVPGDASAGCGCATMSRNDPPHLVALLDLLRKGKAPDLNRVLPGDVVDEVTGARERLDVAGQRRVAADARRALERMIEITEAGRAK
jgi:quinolinate synthase